MPSDAFKLIVGLGNPGADYASTRHNAGFWFVDELARRHGGSFRMEARHQSELARTRIAGHELWLAKPQTFMNHSGNAVQSLAQFYRIAPGEILVAHDEIDLPVGTVRLKQGGGHGGHNGLRDLIAQCGADFWRLRIGVGHPGHKDLVVGYVLKRAPANEQAEIDASIARGADIIPLLVERGAQQAMQHLHGQSNQ